MAQKIAAFFLNRFEIIKRMDRDSAIIVSSVFIGTFVHLFICYAIANRKHPKLDPRRYQFWIKMRRRIRVAILIAGLSFGLFIFGGHKWGDGVVLSVFQMDLILSYVIAVAFVICSGSLALGLIGAILEPFGKGSDPESGNNKIQDHSL